MSQSVDNFERLVETTLIDVLKHNCSGLWTWAVRIYCFILIYMIELIISFFPFYSSLWSIEINIFIELIQLLQSFDIYITTKVLWYVVHKKICPSLFKSEDTCLNFIYILPRELKNFIHAPSFVSNLFSSCHASYCHLMT